MFPLNFNDMVFIEKSYLHFARKNKKGGSRILKMPTPAMVDWVLIQVLL